MNTKYPTLKDFNKVKLYYSSALKQLQTELNVINDELNTLEDIPPIDHLTTRIKTFSSIGSKMQRKNIKLTIENTFLLNDIVGARIVCNFIDDVYDVVKKIKSRNNLNIIMEKDYIKKPKPSGYRGYHIIVNIPIVINEIKKDINCEIQIRTTAMDFWAACEHKLNYKSTCMSENDKNELQKIALDVWNMDVSMNKLARKRKKTDSLERKKETEIKLLDNLLDRRIQDEI